MRYKVYDTRTGKNVTDDPSWILKPDGSLKQNDYGDEIGVPNCVALFYFSESDDAYIDEVGGYHDAGCGVGPDGVPCGECSKLSCKICDIWRRPRIDV